MKPALTTPLPRRRFLKQAALAAAFPVAAKFALADTNVPATSAKAPAFEMAMTREWLARWQIYILKVMRERHCDTQMGEGIGWFMGPYLNGFYYGYMATRDPSWMWLLVDWTDAWFKRGMKEPDGFIGWPKKGSGGAFSQDYYADSLLGEAMALRPVVLMAGEILKTPKLKEKAGAKAERYLEVAAEVYDKWSARGCWREAKEGGVWVAPFFGFDPQTGKFSDGYERRTIDGFSHPANKQNYIALWLIAMYDVLQKPEYKDRAEKWWRHFKARMRPQQDGKYLVWNYWDPAGPWDYEVSGEPRHWVGVHPSGGYYEMDAEGAVAAYEHGLVFSKEDIRRLIATNRDWMWNQQVTGPKFQRIDGRLKEGNKDWSGSLWPALVPYDEKLRKVFVVNHEPASWGGLDQTPWFRYRLVQGFSEI